MRVLKDQYTDNMRHVRVNLKFGRTIYTPESEVIKAIRYDPEQSVLDIAFQNGSMWRYYGIYASTFGYFVSAPSAGKFYNGGLKGSTNKRRLSSWHWAEISGVRRSGTKISRVRSKKNV